MMERPLLAYEDRELIEELIRRKLVVPVWRSARVAGQEKSLGGVDAADINSQLVKAVTSSISEDAFYWSEYPWGFGGNLRRATLLIVRQTRWCGNVEVANSDANGSNKRPKIFLGTSPSRGRLAD
jgi:hypothetical protein